MRGRMDMYPKPKEVTVQEIFDNATPNYYESRGEPTPMVLVGRVHWTERLSAWPLLRALARERSMEARIALVDRIRFVFTTTTAAAGVLVFGLLLLFFHRHRNVVEKRSDHHTAVLVDGVQTEVLREQ